MYLKCVYIYISLGVGKKEELEQIWRFYDQIGSTMLWKLPVMMSHPTTKNDVQLFFFFFFFDRLQMMFNFNESTYQVNVKT